MVGKREQVDGGVALQELDVRRGGQPRQKRGHDRTSRGVPHVKHASTGVGRLERVGRSSALGPVELHAGTLDQDPAQTTGSLVGQHGHRGGKRQSGTGEQDVLGEAVGIRRWTSIAIGFVGVLIIIRPGTDGFTVWSLFALAGVAGWIAAAIALQGGIARLVGAQRMQEGVLAEETELLARAEIPRSMPTPTVRVVEGRDPGFTGGVIGIPGRETVWVPAVWLEAMTAEERAALIARRLLALESGGRGRGIALATAWTLVGFALALLAPRS